MSRTAPAEHTPVGGATLAEQVAALFENPDTPAALHNALADAVNDLTAGFTLAREVLRVSLPLALGSSRHTAEAPADAGNVQSADVPGACSCRVASGDGGGYPPITLERACELADFITRSEDDEQSHALIALLQGIAHALYHGDKLDAESLIDIAGRAAYANTLHSHDGFRHFVELAEDELRATRERLGQDLK